MSTLKADTVTAATTNGNLAISNQGTGGIAIDGMPHKNLIINGDMRIAVRGTSFAAAANGIFSLDRWENIDGGAGVVTITQDTDTPTVAEAGTDFKFSYKVDVTTADASLAATDQYNIHYKIEGFDTAHLGFGAANAATVTLSFWVKSPKTGAHYVAIMNSALDRSYPALFTIASADTWEKQEIVIAGDTSGTWIGATNGIGLRLLFTLAVGTNFDNGTAGAWGAGQNYAASGVVNCMDDAANNFYLTGVQLEVGAAATDFEHRDYASELARCQRYYDKVTGNGSDWVVGFVRSTTTGSYIYQYAVEMRSAPTIAFQSVTDCDVRHAATSTVCSGLGASGKTTKHCSIDATVGSGLTVGHGSYLRWNDADGYVTFDSEL
jgi:hypothetical protein